MVRHGPHQCEVAQRTDQRQADQGCKRHRRVENQDGYQRNQRDEKADRHNNPLIMKETA